MSVKVSSNRASTRRAVAEERLLASRNAGVEGKVSIERGEASSIVDDLFIDANVSAIIRATHPSDAIACTNCGFRRLGGRFGGGGRVDRASYSWSAGEARTPAPAGGPSPRPHRRRDDQ